MKELKCTLPESVRREKRCKCKGCKGCGWEKSERDQRAEYLKKHGLTQGKDGLYRLVMDD